jgi:hypothetical protein
VEVSRITTAPFIVGDPATAADLNTAFTDVATATAALDENNHRDQAVDLPQLESAYAVVKQAADVVLSHGSFSHATFQTIPPTTVGPAVLAELVDGGGSPTRLGPVVWQLAEDDVLRVYWHVSAEPVYQGTPWASANYGAVTYNKTSGTLSASDGFHVWVIHLQWNTTDPTLATGWVAVPGQNDMQGTVPTTSDYGASLADVAAQSLVSAWLLHDDSLANKGLVASMDDDAQGWRPAHGAWLYSVPNALAGTVVYGFRLVVSGVYHPYRTTSTNYLVLDTGAGAAGVALNINTGRLTAVQMRPG